MIKTKTFIMASAALLLFTSTANAQEDHSEIIDELLEVDRETVLTLAQQCVGEIDFENPAECWVMWHINADLAEMRLRKDPTWRLVDQLRAYNSIFKTDSPRSMWVRELDLEGNRPEHWDDKAGSWDSFRQRWGLIVAAAWHFLESPGKRPCASANAYGGSCLDPKGACDKAPKCWVQVVCHSDRQKPFRQAYYSARRCGS